MNAHPKRENNQSSPLSQFSHPTVLSTTGRPVKLQNGIKRNQITGHNKQLQLLHLLNYPISQINCTDSFSNTRDPFQQTLIVAVKSQQIQAVQNPRN